MKKFIVTCLLFLCCILSPSVPLAQVENEIEEKTSPWVGDQAWFLVYLTSNGYNTYIDSAFAQGNFRSLMRLLEAGHVEANEAFHRSCLVGRTCSYLVWGHQFRLSEYAVDIFQTKHPGSSTAEFLRSMRNFDSNNDSTPRGVRFPVGPIVAVRVLQIDASSQASCDYWARIRLFIDEKSDFGEALLNSDEFTVNACFKYGRDGLNFEFTSWPVY